jgi:hypothetical protein
MSFKKLTIASGAMVLVLVAMQSFRSAPVNPPSDPSASSEAVAKPSQEVASSLKRACYDCHSNQTVWPVYSHIPPVSWLVACDVNQGRGHLNFSEWTRPGPEGEMPNMGEVCEQVRAGKMPLRAYLLLHPQAKLSEQEINALCSGTEVKE